MNLIIRTASADDVETLLAFEEGIINTKEIFIIEMKKCIE
jgi:hypothetical protein